MLKNNGVVTLTINYQIFVAFRRKNRVINNIVT